MKKTIAKLMAAAMLVASLPAMTMPTFTVKAADGDALTNKQATSYASAGFAIDGAVYDSTSSTPTITLDNAKVVDANSYKLNIQIISNQKGADTYQVKNVVYSVLKNTELKSGQDYYDHSSTVEKIKTDAEGYPVVYFNADKLTNYKNNTILKGQEPKNIEFILNNNATGATQGFNVKIPVGHQLSLTKDTKYTSAYTEDGFISGATVTVDKAGNATLISVPDQSRKVDMRKQKIDVSEIIVAAISFPVEKFDEQALKGAKMKTITAKNVKHLGSGCLRNCKKLRKARLGGAKMRKIHSNAFYDCDKLNNIKLNIKNLKSVGSKAFMNLKSGCTIALKGPKAKYNKAVKMIKKSGTGKVKFKKA